MVLLESILKQTPGNLFFSRNPTRLEAGVHVKAVLTWLNMPFLPISRSRFRSNAKSLCLLH